MHVCDHAIHALVALVMVQHQKVAPVSPLQTPEAQSRSAEVFAALKDDPELAAVFQVNECKGCCVLIGYIREDPLSLMPIETWAGMKWFVLSGPLFSEVRCLASLGVFEQKHATDISPTKLPLLSRLSLTVSMPVSVSEFSTTSFSVFEIKRLDNI